VPALLLGLETPATVLTSAAAEPVAGAGLVAGAESAGAPEPQAAADTQGRMAVVIVLDGARPDGIAQADTPNIDQLIAAGAAAEDAHTTYPFVTLPCHISMLSGVRFYQHRITLNSYVEPMPTLPVRTVFDLCAEHDLRTLMLVGKKKLDLLRPAQDSLNEFRLVDLEQVGFALREATAGAMPSLVLIHSAEPDVTGHSSGWMSPAYLKALSRDDRMIGQVVDWVRERGMWERTLILISADHGGFAKGHSGGHPADVAIPWIVSGGLAKGAKLPARVYLQDTAPTVLRMLGLPLPPNLDGRPVDGLQTYPVSSRSP